MKFVPEGACESSQPTEVRARNCSSASNSSRSGLTRPAARIQRFSQESKMWRMRAAGVAESIGHVHAAGLENADHADNRGRGFRHQDADAVALFAAGLLEQVCELVAGVFQLAVGHRFAAHDDGGGVGARFGLLSDPTLEQSVHEVIFPGKRVSEPGRE